MEKIRESKAPQVLRVDHDEADDAISLSGDSEVDSDEEYSPLKDEEYIHKVRDENHMQAEDESLKILPSGSTQFSFFLQQFLALFFFFTVFQKTFV